MIAVWARFQQRTRKKAGKPLKSGNDVRGLNEQKGC